MAESRSCMSDRDRKDNYGIDVNRILDSCRDKDWLCGYKGIPDRLRSGAY